MSDNSQLLLAIATRTGNALKACRSKPKLRIPVSAKPITWTPDLNSMAKRENTHATQ